MESISTVEQGVSGGERVKMTPELLMKLSKEADYNGVDRLKLIEEFSKTLQKDFDNNKEILGDELSSIPAIVEKIRKNLTKKPLN
jgi:hypothetical protein